jgi:hypothetical protein
MRTDVIIVDHFYDDWRGVLEFALKQEYYFPYESNADVESGRRRASWLTSRFKPASDCPFKSSVELIRRLEEITGEQVDLDHWNRIYPTDSEGKPAPRGRNMRDTACVWNCSFHCKPDNGQELGEGVHNHVTDNWNSVGVHGWAGLIYLNDDAPLSGGLKVWRNIDPAHQFDWMTPKENWELIDDFGNVPNRLILCRGNLPHSGARGWGDSLLTGRLYQTFFFKTGSPILRDGVLVSL